MWIDEPLLQYFPIDILPLANPIITQPITLKHLEFFAEKLSSLFEAGDTLLLEGGLGAGKTTLVQLIASNLDIGDDQYVSSPSFSLLHEYSGTVQVFHMDLYRLTDEDDVEAAGLLDYLEHQGLCLIEWPERLGSAKPPNYLQIEIGIPDSDHRTLTLSAYGPRWTQRLPRLIRLVEQVNEQDT